MKWISWRSHTVAERTARGSTIAGAIPTRSRPEAVQKVAANFTHSADAALMHAVALVARQEGIEIIPVHDCWACLAPHAARLNHIVRDRMKWLHTQHDWLGQAYRTALAELPGVDIKPRPRRATMTLRTTTRSYFNIC